MHFKPAAYVAAHARWHASPIPEPKARSLQDANPSPSPLPVTSSRAIADMLRAATRLAPSLVPRAEAALGTRSMSLAGMKGE